MFKDETTITELKRIISQLEISATTITFRTKKYDILPENAVNSLINILYSECYALKEKHQNGLAKNGNFEFALDESFLAQLSENNLSLDKIDTGWEIKQNHLNGFLDVTKHDKIKTIHYTQIVKQNTTDQSKPLLDLSFPKEDKYRQKTFYYVFSNENFDTNKKMTRIYWNIKSQGAASLIHEITKKFNHYNIPFIFKCLNHPNLYFRRDAAVLYVYDENLAIVTFLLPDIWNRLQEHLEADVPLFTFKYKKGLGIAENPSLHESFGMNRIGIVAASLINNCASPLNENQILERISNDFLKKGINPESPYLNKGSRRLLN